MRFGKRQQELPSFQFTPMLDVVFLLLSFFVASSVFSQWEMEVDVTLPNSKTAVMPDRLPGEVIVNVSRDGAITVNQRKFTADELSSRLSRLASLYPGQSVVIRADKKAEYEMLMNVIDSCRGAGIWNISFATNEE